MLRSRVLRALAGLLVFVTQAAVALPHSMKRQGESAHVTAMAEMPGCHHGTPAQEHSKPPKMPCGSCPTGMPGSGGHCVDMAGCASATTAVAPPPVVALTTTVLSDTSLDVRAPPAHDFIPDPPPPRA